MVSVQPMARLAAMPAIAVATAKGIGRAPRAIGLRHFDQWLRSDSRSHRSFSRYVDDARMPQATKPITHAIQASRL